LYQSGVVPFLTGREPFFSRSRLPPFSFNVFPFFNEDQAAIDAGIAAKNAIATSTQLCSNCTNYLSDLRWDDQTLISLTFFMIRRRWALSACESVGFFLDFALLMLN
jgi:hypothetical protein